MNCNEISVTELGAILGIGAESDRAQIIERISQLLEAESRLKRIQERDSINTTKRVQRMKAAREQGTHSREEWDALLVACNDCCVRCKTSGKRLVKDHITHVYMGGSDSIDNIQPLCSLCNGGKGMEMVDWRPKDWRQKMNMALADPELMTETMMIRMKRGW